MRRSSYIDNNKVLPFAELSREELQKLASFKPPAKPRRNTLVQAVVEDIWKRLSEEHMNLQRDVSGADDSKLNHVINEVVQESN